MLVTAEEAGLSGAQSCLAEGVECSSLARLQGCRHACVRAQNRRCQVRMGINSIHASTASRGTCLLYEWEAVELSALY